MILNVVYTVNGHLQLDKITEWDENSQGAEKKFTDVWVMLVNEVTVLDAEVKVLDDQLNVYNGLQRHITHAKVDGYLSDGKFYANYNEETGKYTDEIAGRNDTLYVDITDPKKPVNYKWNGSAFVKA